MPESVYNSFQYRGLPGFTGEGFKDGYHFVHHALPFVTLERSKAIQPITKYGNLGVFAGEIFNWTEFGRYRQHANDSEMIHDMFQRHGFEHFEEFDGFWSYATLYQGKLLAITDYLAQKPVYYRSDMDAVASEIDVLKLLGDVTPNEAYLSATEKWGYYPGPETPWNEIKQVPPGHYYYNGSVYQYWNWDKVKAYDLRQDLETAVINRLGGKREVSILLSGGLDSTIIYGLIKASGRSIQAIHVDNSEESYAKLVTQDLIKCTMDEVDPEEALIIHQTPVDLGSVVPQIAMARKLKELGFLCVMTGDGADELFGGYRRAAEYDSQHSDVFHELPYYHNPRLDRIMMRETIELRAPFLSARVVKHALELPYEKRNGIKHALVEAFADLVPDEILNRTKHPLKTDGIRHDPMGQRKLNRQLWGKIHDLG